MLIFTRRDPQPARAPQSAEHEKTPRILLEEFTLYEYQGSKAVSSLSGKFASFMDPNTVEMFGNLQGQRLDSKRREFFAAESATMQFAAKGLVELMKNSRPQLTTIENQVRFGYDDVILYTDYARYLHDQERLISDLPVRIQGPKVDLMGSKGFEYQTKTKDLKVFGPLEGTLLGLDAD
ncbi:MAG: hypothetical protein ACOVS5_16195, partial [Oligoflexus sp.]